VTDRYVGSDFYFVLSPNSLSRFAYVKFEGRRVGNGFSNALNWFFLSKIRVKVKFDY
jgi:hypothetical protein